MGAAKFRAGQQIYHFVSGNEGTSAHPSPHLASWSAAPWPSVKAAVVASAAERSAVERKEIKASLDHRQAT